MAVLKAADGAELYYDDQGSGPALLFLHGCWCSSAFFETQAQALSDRYRVLRLDFRGHGFSASVAEGLTVPTLASDVHCLIDQLELDPLIAVGWSMGALAIWEHHRQFGSNAFRGAIVVDQPASDFRWPDWPLAFADFDELRGLMEQTQIDRPKLVARLLDGMFKEPVSKTDREWMAREMLLPSPAVAASILFDQTLRDYRETLRSFAPKTLVCFGADEKIMPVELGRHLAEQLPDARLEVFESSGHCPFFEEPDRFNRLVDEFARSLAGS